MKVLLIYYTGTYNTRYLTNKIEQEFTNKGDIVNKVEINYATPVVTTEGYDLVGFGYPIYGFNSPLPFNKYFKKLKFTRGQKYFIYKNSGETLAMNNASSRIIIRRMKKKKAVFSGEYHYVMPYNIHFAYDKDFVREILDYDNKLLAVMMNNLSNGTIEKIKSNLFYDIGAFFVGIQKLGGPINSLFYKVDNDRCVKCHLCVTTCPQNNVKIGNDGKVKFGHHCDMCMRCSFYCPTNAISIGLLKNWKVNGDYKLKELEDMGAPEKPYITKDSSGFYKCFIKTFKEIDEKYNALNKE